MLKKNINNSQQPTANSQQPTANSQHAKTHPYAEVKHKTAFCEQVVSPAFWNLNLLNQVTVLLKNKQDHLLFCIATKSKTSNKTLSSQALQNKFLAKRHSLNEFIAGTTSASMTRENLFGKDFKQSYRCVFVRQSPLKFEEQFP